MGIIFNEIVINKSVFRMVLSIIYEWKIFQFMKCHYFCLCFFDKAQAKLKIAKRNLPSYFVWSVVNSFR